MKGKQNCLRWGLTAFLTVCAILVFYDTFFLSGTLQKFFSKLMGILAPILYGCGMAYLLAPVVNFLEQKLLRGLTAGKYKKGRSWARAISIFLTWAVVGFLFYILMNILIPQLANSVGACKCICARSTPASGACLFGWRWRSLRNHSRPSMISPQW